MMPSLAFGHFSHGRKDIPRATARPAHGPLRGARLEPRRQPEQARAVSRGRPAWHTPVCERRAPCRESSQSKRAVPRARRGVRPSRISFSCRATALPAHDALIGLRPPIRRAQGRFSPTLRQAQGRREKGHAASNRAVSPWAPPTQPSHPPRWEGSLERAWPGQHDGPFPPVGKGLGKGGPRAGCRAAPAGSRPCVEPAANGRRSKGLSGPTTAVGVGGHGRGPSTPSLRSVAQDDRMLADAGSLTRGQTLAY
jgi:hypothetical protein